MPDILTLMRQPKTIIVFTGIFCTGKRTLASKLNEQLGYYLLSLDDYRVTLYDTYGFTNKQEKSILDLEAKTNFAIKCIQLMRAGDSFIVEHAFTEDWQEFFDSMTSTYGYHYYVVNCRFQSFDVLWNRRIQRDHNLNQRHVGLTAWKYFKDTVYATDVHDYNDEAKKRYREAYKYGAYTRLIGEECFEDETIIELLGGTVEDLL